MILFRARDIAGNYHTGCLIVMANRPFIVPVNSKQAVPVLPDSIRQLVTTDSRGHPIFVSDTVRLPDGSTTTIDTLLPATMAPQEPPTILPVKNLNLSTIIDIPDILN